MYNPIFGTGDGSAPVVNLTWPFIDKAHVQAKAGGSDVGITWTGPSQIKFNVPVANGVPYQVERNTSRDAQLVDFENGSVLTEEDLDRSNLQLLYVSQEITSLILRSDLENLLGLYNAMQVRLTADEAILAGKSPIGHGHIIADVSGLQTALDGKQPAGSYAAATHTHTIAQVTSLQGSLDAKSNVGHSHPISDITGLQGALDGKLGAASIVAGLNVNVVNNGNGTITISATGGGGGGGGGNLVDGNYGDVTVSGGATIMTVTKVGGQVPSFPGHTHTIANVTGLQTALDGKATVVHTHPISDIVGLQGALDGKQVAGAYAAAAHTHVIANVTGLQGALDGKQAVGSYATTAERDVLTAAVNGKAGSYLPVADVSANFTPVSAHVGYYFRLTAGVTVALDNGVAAGFSCIAVNRSGANVSLACTAGMYKNGATGTVTTGTLAPGGRVTLIHEGGGVWTADGKGLS